MTYFNIIENMRRDCTFELSKAVSEYSDVSKALVEPTTRLIKDAKLTSKLYGEGTVTNVSGSTFGTLIIEVTFPEVIKQFSLMHIMTTTVYITFIDNELIKQYLKAHELHTELKTLYDKYKIDEKLLEREAKKQEAAANKAKERQEKLKNKFTADLEALVNGIKTPIRNVNEFYYMIGWLAKNIGTVSATMPEFLSPTFKSYFGDDVVHKTISSNQKTSGGNAMQWTFSFKATIRNAAKAPKSLSTYLNSTGKAITSTAFIWDLVKFHGFSFGKTQDVEQIRQFIPEENLEDFENGFNSK